MDAKKQKKFPRLQIFEVPYDLYEHKVYVVIGKHLKDIEDFVNLVHPDCDEPYSFRDAIPEGDRGMAGCTIFCEGYDPVIVLPRFPKTPSDYNTVAHEAMHFVQYMFTNIGLRLTFDTCEAYSYAIGYFVQQVIEAKKQFTAKGKKKNV